MLPELISQPVLFGLNESASPASGPLWAKHFERVQQNSDSPATQDPEEPELFRGEEMVDRQESRVNTEIRCQMFVEFDFHCHSPFRFRMDLCFHGPTIIQAGRVLR